MNWIKKDLIFVPFGKHDWAQTHAQVPSAIVFDDHIRVYYTSRDTNGRSHTSFVNLSKKDPSKILYIHEKPVMNLGKPGTHDEDGVMVGHIVALTSSTLLMYYTGWSRSLTVPYRVSVGLAKSTDGGVSFERVFNGPIVDRTPYEPYMTMSPFVLKVGNSWKMWYGSGTEWVSVNNKMEPIYIIKYAESDDGIRWIQKNVTCIQQNHPLEANTRPSVLKNDSEYEMWFSYRHSLDFRNGGGSYRIGYATSKDGEAWIRHEDQSGLKPQNSGWDSNMTAYPSVVEVHGQRIMFYNGNGFGKTGFGYAIWS